MAWRFALGAFVLIVVAGASTAVLAIGEVNRLVAALNTSKAVQLPTGTLAPTTPGAPETLLFVGNDERPPPKDNPFGAVAPHSNEMLLVRIDPSQPTISMLSIPRELQVTFKTPDGVLETNRINSAYTFGYEEGGGTSGGVKLMLNTIKHVLGVTVNHVFITNFPKFKRAVDELGCVYMTVDRRYFHVNEPGGEQYFEINLQPGYQRLCGQEALQFVANRHEDTSLTRDARDQRFLFAVKGEFGPSALGNREKYERIFGRAVQTDSALHSSDHVLQLLELLAESAGKPVRQVPFHVNLLADIDTASEQEIEKAVHSFETGTSALPASALAHAVHAVGTHAHQSHRGRHARSSSPSPTAGMAPTPASTLEEGRVMAKTLPLRVDLPRYQFTTAEAGPDQLRRYNIHGPHGHRFPSYVAVVGRGGLGEYYDVQGSSWTDPPLLERPNAQVHLGSRTYGLFYDGEHIRTIAWHEGEAVYWIENTLTNGLSPEQMARLADETLPVSNQFNRPANGLVHVPGVRGFVLPSDKVSTSLREQIGAGAAFVVLIALGFMAYVLVRRRGELDYLRGQVGAALAAEARVRVSR
jgi:LCP family protein required for cell wall assembly